MIHPKTKALIERLVNESDKLQSKWAASTMRDQQYGITSSSANIVIRKRKESDIMMPTLKPEPAYTFAIVDQIGNIIEEVKVYDKETEPQDYLLLQKLYETALRSSNNTDQIIDRLDSEIFR